MALLSIGVNFKKATAYIRSMLALDISMNEFYLKSLISIPGVDQAVILSTCNRTEMYLIVSNEKKVENILKWWACTCSCSYDLAQHIEIKKEREVVEHLMRLSCGLESMVIGEPQILGQLKESYQSSMRMNCLGGRLDRIFQYIFYTAKQIRANTKIGECPVSVAFSAVALARQTIDNLTHKSVAVVGAGATGRLIMQHLSSCNPKNLWIINRTLCKAKKLASMYQKAQYFSFDELEKVCLKADLVVIAISTDNIILGKTYANKLIKHQLLIDLCIPFSIDESLAEHKYITLHSVDDIQDTIKNSKRKRKKEAESIEKSIKNYVDRCMDKEKRSTS